MILGKIVRYLRKKYMPADKYARYVGVTVGKNCLIATKHFSTEPYLITIGNNCQITDDVHFHTHGGAHVARRQMPQFDVFGKIHVKDWAYIGSTSHIMPGVTVGEGSLIAAGSIVTRSVPDGEVWGGYQLAEFAVLKNILNATSRIILIQNICRLKKRENCCCHFRMISL